MAATLDKPVTGAALTRLQRYYDDRTLAMREALARGERVVGRVGNTAPVELILAAGFTPVMIAADLTHPTPTSNVYMDDIIAPETKVIFQAAVDGDFEALDLLVLTRAYDKLFYYLKEIYRLGRAPKLPPLQMFDLMQSQREAVAHYNFGRIELLKSRLERAAGRTITQEALNAAIKATNRVRALQRRLQVLRDAGLVAGAEAMQVLGAGYFMAPGDYAGALSDYLDEAGRRDPFGKRPRLLVLSSEPLQHLSLHETLEEAGALVVAEDNWWGSRAAGADIGLSGSPLEAILRKYWLETQTQAVHPPAAREAWFLEQARRPDIDGVIFHLPPSDGQLGWDYPRLAREIETLGKTSLLLRQDVTTPDGRRIAADDKLPAFLSGL